MGMKWDDNKVRQEILNVKNTLGIERMPSRQEIDLVTQNTALSNKIMKTKGMRGWAKELGLDLKNSETKLGQEYELIIKDMIEKRGYKVDKMTTRHPYDLLVNNSIKIDVKVSRYYHGETYKYHTFGLGKKYHNCDIFICVGIDKEENIEKILIIPSKFLMDIRQLSVGIKSEYDKYNEAWEYLDKYDRFYKELI